MAGKIDVAVIGGGLGGLISAIDLSRRGYAVQLFEKRNTLSTGCGRIHLQRGYPYLERLNSFPHALDPSRLHLFELTSPRGNEASMPLDLGGFGVSRYKLDSWLVQRAQEEGVTVTESTHVESVKFEQDTFLIKASEEYAARLVIGAFGKRSTLDASLQRPSFRDRSPYVGVKYHVHTEMEQDTIALHNFEGGYCGISAVEDGRFNLCYLAPRSLLKRCGDIATMEKQVLQKNPHLAKIFTTSEFLTPPYAVNEVSFHRKEVVHNHVLMVGDAAGMITPLCGNGMALAIHAAKIASEKAASFLDGNVSRAQMEHDYTRTWRSQFNLRLRMGRNIQRLFGSVWLSNVAVGIVNRSRPLSRFLMRSTHGAPIQ